MLALLMSLSLAIADPSPAPSARDAQLAALRVESTEAQNLALLRGVGTLAASTVLLVVVPAELWTHGGPDWGRGPYYASMGAGLLVAAVGVPLTVNSWRRHKVAHEAYLALERAP